MFGTEYVFNVVSHWHIFVHVFYSSGRDVQLCHPCQ